MMRVHVDDRGTGNLEKILAGVPAQEKQEETSVSGAVPAEPRRLWTRWPLIREGRSSAVGTLTGKQFPPGEDPGPLDLGDGDTRRALEKLFEDRFGAPALEDLNRGVKEGTVKPRPVEASKAERTELLAAEIYARRIENEPIPEQALLQLAAMRARSVAAELENTCGIPPDRISIREPESQPEGEGRFVKLSLDALSPSK